MCVWVCLFQEIKDKVAVKQVKKLKDRLEGAMENMPVADSNQPLPLTPAEKPVRSTPSGNHEITSPAQTPVE